MGEGKNRSEEEGIGRRAKSRAGREEERQWCVKEDKCWQNGINGVANFI